MELESISWEEFFKIAMSLGVRVRSPEELEAMEWRDLEEEAAKHGIWEKPGKNWKAAIPLILQGQYDWVRSSQAEAVEVEEVSPPAISEGILKPESDLPQEPEAEPRGSDSPPQEMELQKPAPVYPTAILKGIGVKTCKQCGSSRHTSEGRIVCPDPNRYPGCKGLH